MLSLQLFLDHRNIVFRGLGCPFAAAVKEASGNLSQIVSLFHRAAARLDVYSGNDDQIVPILAMGGEGCISVLSNVLPREAVRLCELFFSGDVRGAAALQCRLLPVIDALFSEVNPIPPKAALAKMGYGTDTLRLPLTPMEENRENGRVRSPKWGLFYKKHKKISLF